MDSGFRRNDVSRFVHPLLSMVLWLPLDPPVKPEGDNGWGHRTLANLGLTLRANEAGVSKVGGTV